MITFGTYTLGTAGETPCAQAVAAALRAGYRRIDTAVGYMNEAQVAQGIAESGVSRSEIHITTKLSPKDMSSSPEKLRQVIDNSLRIFGGYVDCFLLHWPGAAGLKPEALEKQLEMRRAAWAVLSSYRHPQRQEQSQEQQQQLPSIREIGVSNFLPRHLDSLAGGAPVEVVQMELHPLCMQRDVMEWIRRNPSVGRVEAYGLVQCAGEMTKMLLPSQQQQQEQQADPAAAAATDPSMMDELLVWAVKNRICPIVRASSAHHMQRNLAVMRQAQEFSTKRVDDFLEQNRDAPDRHMYWFSDKIA